MAAPSVLWLSSRGSRTPALRLPRTGAILLTPLLIAVAACAGLAGPKPGPPPASTSSGASALPPSTPTGAPSPAPRRGGTLRLPGRDPSTLDPALARDVSAAQYIYEIYSGLVSLRGDLAIVPDLATRWSRSGDGRTYTFTLRANARFHDGRPVTAADVVFSFERACDPATASPVAETYLGDIVGCTAKLAGRVPRVEGAQVAGEHTVVLTIDAPKAYFLAKLTYPTSFVVDRRQVSKPGWTARPNATGPFRLDVYEPDEKLVLARNDDYYGRPPHLDRVVFDLRPTVTETRYENGELDATPIGVGDLERARDPLNPLSRELVEGPGGLGLTYLAFNTRRAPFDDPQVRRAIHLAIDRDRIARVVLRGAARPLATILPPAMPGYDPSKAVLGPDPAAARKALASSSLAGYTTAITLTTPGVGGADPVVLAVADAISETLGLRVILEQAPWPLFQKELAGGKYQMWVLGWSADYPDPQDFLDVLFHSRAPLNYTGYADADVDALLEAARAGDDPDKRLALYRQAEALILEASPWVPLYTSRAAWLVNRRVKGFTVPPVVVPRLGAVWLAADTR